MAKNLLDSKFFDSRITSPNVTAKEKWIGFLIGPTGALLVNALLAEDVSGDFPGHRKNFGCDHQLYHGLDH